MAHLGRGLARAVVVHQRRYFMSDMMMRLNSVFKRKDTAAISSKMQSQPQKSQRVHEDPEEELTAEKKFMQGISGLLAALSPDVPVSEVYRSLTSLVRLDVIKLESPAQRVASATRLLDEFQRDVVAISEGRYPDDLALVIFLRALGIAAYSEHEHSYASACFGRATQIIGKLDERTRVEYMAQLTTLQAACLNHMREYTKARELAMDVVNGEYNKVTPEAFLQAIYANIHLKDTAEAQQLIDALWKQPSGNLTVAIKNQIGLLSEHLETLKVEKLVTSETVLETLEAHGKAWVLVDSVIGASSKIKERKWRNNKAHEMALAALRSFADQKKLSIVAFTGAPIEADATEHLEVVASSTEPEEEMIRRAMEADDVPPMIASPYVHAQMELLGHSEKCLPTGHFMKLLKPSIATVLPEFMTKDIEWNPSPRTALK